MDIDLSVLRGMEREREIPFDELVRWGRLVPGTKVVKGDGLFPRADPKAEPPVAVPEG